MPVSGYGAISKTWSRHDWRIIQGYSRRLEIISTPEHTEVGDLHQHGCIGMHRRVWRNFEWELAKEKVGSGRNLGNLW